MRLVITIQSIPFQAPGNLMKEYWRVNLLQQCELTKLSEDYLLQNS